MVGARLIGIVLGGIATLALVASVAAANASVTTTEANNLYAFTPARVFVNVGGSVTWTNGTDAPHTVTSNTGSELASSTLSPNATFSHAFNATGTFAYHCTIHTYMKGTVVVLAAGATLPATDTVAETPGPTQPNSSVPIVLLALGAGFLLVRLFLVRRKA